MLILCCYEYPSVTVALSDPEHTTKYLGVSIAYFHELTKWYIVPYETLITPQLLKELSAFSLFYVS